MVAFHLILFISEGSPASWLERLVIWFAIVASCLLSDFFLALLPSLVHSTIILSNSLFRAFYF